jgi:AcrR family transcriptional regulator
MAGTRERLIAGAIETLRRQGITGTSARSIAATAGVNQALVFYHFGSVDELLNQACLASTTDRLGAYRDRFAAAASLRELLDLGGRLHQEERSQGNVAVLAQLLAAAQTDERFVPICKRSLDLWSAEVEQVLRRVLAGSPVADLADPAGLARAVSAAFIGLELYEGVDPEGAAGVFATLDRLAVLFEVVDGLGPVARRALQAKLRKVP